MTLLGVAAAAGVASFFSPCSFPLLPTYLSVTALRRRDGGGRWAGAAADGAVAGTGVVAFNVLLGGAVGLLGAGFGASLTLLSPNPSGVSVAVRFIVAGFLVLVGVLQLAEKGAHSRLSAYIAGAFQRLARKGEGRMAPFLYGFAYTAIGIGCTGPFLASVVLVGIASGGFASGLLAFTVFAFTMAGLMVVVSLLAEASPRRTKALARAAPRVKRVAGAILVAFGALLAVFTLNPFLLRPLFP